MNNLKQKIPKVVKDRIFQIRIEEDIKYGDIVKRIKEEFDKDVSLDMCSKIVRERMAQSVVENPKETNELFKKQIDKMEERFEGIADTMDWLHETIHKIRDGFEASDMTEMQKQINFMKMVPSIIPIVKEIREQIQFLRNEQQNIINFTQNNFLSPLQVNQQVNAVIKKLDKDGDIKILKPLSIHKKNAEVV